MENALETYHHMGQDMDGARLTHRGMRSRLLNPGRFSYLERTTWELSKYVIRKVAGNVL